MPIYKNLTIENVRLIFRNFSGKATQYSPEGTRYFSVVLDEESAHELEKDGWLIKWLEPRSPDEDRIAHLKVKVKFNKIPPKIVIVNSEGKTYLEEDSINVLDWAEIESVDLIIRPYNWKMADGRSGLTAYLKTMYVTVVEDEFEKKYRDVPDTLMPPLEEEDKDGIPF